MKKYLKNYKTSVPAILIFVVMIAYLLGYIEREKLEVVIGILTTMGLLGARDVTSSNDGN